MSENKIAKVPVASHGLHRHSYNYPWLSSINFGDVMPCYYNTVRKGERDTPKAGVFSQLMPIAHNAFATGRFNFKAIFVPYKLVWRPWYSFDQQVDYFSNGQSSRPGRYPFVESGRLSDSLCKHYGTADGTLTDHDVVLLSISGGSTTPTYYHLNSAGRRILRILMALGTTPSFVVQDTRPLNILPCMCYIKAFADYYFPNNYVNGTEYAKLSKFFDTDYYNFVSLTVDFLRALEVCSLNYYENSIFDLAWDNPVSPSAGSNPVVEINDVTSTPASGSAVVSSDDVTNEGTPLLTADNSWFTQYSLNALKSLTMWMKRRQLSGARLLEKFLVSRGITLPDDSARISYFLGQRNIEIEVSGVANTTDENLGELAGRGIASSGNEPLSFECRAEDDGIFIVIVSPIPDANFPVYVDGFVNRQDFMQNYNAEFDKLGAAAVPLRILQQTTNGMINNYLDPTRDGVFGFLSQYWDEVQERPRLLGDFCLPSRGAEELQAYHTFRIFNVSELGDTLVHSYDFQRMGDNSQYQRLFYSDQQENLMLFLRWYGSQYKEKLPLGDSYDWDDDEFNRKVSVVVGGSQK